MSAGEYHTDLVSSQNDNVVELVLYRVVELDHEDTAHVPRYLLAG